MLLSIRRVFVTHLMPQQRRDDTSPHVAEETACLPTGVRALQALTEISATRLNIKRDTTAMRVDGIAARPAKVNAAGERCDENCENAGCSLRTRV